MTPMETSENMDEILELAPGVPVLLAKDPAQARPLAKALITGGLRVLDLTGESPPIGL